MLSADPLLRPWFDRLFEDLPGLELVDAHTHIGHNDPDGFAQTPEELIERLAAAGARAVVFAMHEPGGYPAANDAVLEAASASGGRLAAFCRLDPRDGAVAEAERCLDAGALGIKLHPRAERFGLGEPSVRGIFALADERQVPILVHAGRGIPALGKDTLRLTAEFPRARVILAHAAISDLAWLWRHAPEHPNLFVDTAWWSAADLLALYALFPPGQVLFASDSPYGTPVEGAIVSLRLALQAGLSAAQVTSIAGEQLARLLDGEQPADLGPAPGTGALPIHPLLDRVAANLYAAMNLEVRDADGSEALALARLSCAVGADSPLAHVCGQVLELIDRYEEHARVPKSDRLRFSDLGVLACALAVARSPDVGLPVLADEPVAEREQITG